MQIDVFGKQDCAICNTTKRKLGHFLAKWELAGSVPMKWVDLDTVDGSAEGAFEDIFEVPTVIVRHEGEEVRRWAGTIPDSEDFRRAVRA